MCGVAVDPACKENNQPSIINQRYNKYKDIVCVTFVKSVRLNATYYLGQTTIFFFFLMSFAKHTVSYLPKEYTKHYKKNMLAASVTPL